MKRVSINFLHKGINRRSASFNNTCVSIKLKTGALNEKRRELPLSHGMGLDKVAHKCN